MTKMTGGWGRIVWMPTFDSENQVRFAKENRPFVSVSRNGELLPAVRDVIALVAKHDLILATGHSSADEGLLLLREARRQNARRVIVTHAMNDPIRMTVPQMKEAASLGAFIEFVGSSPAAPDANARYDRFADAIRQIGPQFCILSSDLGQMGNPLPADGFGRFISAMRERGFSAEDIDRMARQIPRACSDCPDARLCRPSMQRCCPRHAPSRVVPDLRRQLPRLRASASFPG